MQDVNVSLQRSLQFYQIFLMYSVSVYVKTFESVVLNS